MMSFPLSEAPFAKNKNLLALFRLRQKPNKQAKQKNPTTTNTEKKPTFFEKISFLCHALEKLVNRRAEKILGCLGKLFVVQAASE